MTAGSGQYGFAACLRFNHFIAHMVVRMLALCLTTYRAMPFSPYW